MGLENLDAALTEAERGLEEGLREYLLFTQEFEVVSVYLPVDLLGYELSGISKVDQGNFLIRFFVVIEFLLPLRPWRRTSFIACLADSRGGLLISFLAIAFILRMLLKLVEEVGEHLEEMMLLG